MALFTCAPLADGGGEIPGCKTFTNMVGMQMVKIAPGDFTMGYAGGKDAWDGEFDERPEHKVTITQPFYMAATEVNNAQYEQFDPSHKALRGKRGLSKEDDEAVIFVSWNDAVKFCEWLSIKEGKPYRLPTEAEWEYACRAGTKTDFSTPTGELTPEYFKNQQKVWSPKPVSLQVGKTLANPWGLYDMHGNVEEWCHDWYGPYVAGEQADPVGYEDGDFRVTRGGSHNTETRYLRSANRQGTLPEDKHWLIGFRVVMGELPKTMPLPKPAPALWAQNVSQKRFDWPETDASKPYFKGPRRYIKIPPGSNGPLYSNHSHQPALIACPNGDLFAIWFTTWHEDGREMSIAASRLRRGSEDWEQASLFWNPPDRNDTGCALWWDGKETLYHFNGLSVGATWGALAMVMRTSTDNGATWSRGRLIFPEYNSRNQVIAGVFQTKRGDIFVQGDVDATDDAAKPGTAVHISPDNAKTWYDPGDGKSLPVFKAGQSGAWIAGIHAGVAELKDGRIMALGRMDPLGDKTIPRSISADGGKTWAYSSSGLQPTIGSRRRLVLMRLKEGPLFMASFWNGQTVTNSAGKTEQVAGLYGALSFDEGETWPVKRLITDDGPDRTMETASNVMITFGRTSAEDAGYLAACQTPDGLIQLISSRYHYTFNQKWLATPPPPPFTAAEQRMAQEERLNRAANDNEKSDALFRIGESYLAEKNYPAARVEYAKVIGIEIAPEHEREMVQRMAESHLKMGQIFKAETNYPAARAELAKVLEIKGARPAQREEAQMSIGNIHLAEKNYPAARAEFAKVQELGGVSVFGKAHARLMMGYACMAEKNYPAARVEFSKAVEISRYDYQKGQAQLEIGNAYMAEGNWPVARAEYEKVLKIEGAKEQNKKDARLAIEKIDGQSKAPSEK